MLSAAVCSDSAASASAAALLRSEAEDWGVGAGSDTSAWTSRGRGLHTALTGAFLFRLHDEQLMSLSEQDGARMMVVWLHEVLLSQQLSVPIVVLYRAAVATRASHAAQLDPMSGL